MQDVGLHYLQAFFMSAYIVLPRYWYPCTPVYRLNGHTASGEIVLSNGSGTDTSFIVMMNNLTSSNAAMLSGSGTSAYETGTQSFSTNALRFYNAEGKRRRKASATSALRSEMAVTLMSEHSSVRCVKIHDSGISFSARVKLHGGGTVHRTAYNLQNLYGLLLEGIRERRPVTILPTV